MADHVLKAEERVSTWPAWKQKAIEVATKSSKEEAKGEIVTLNAPLKAG